MSSEEQRRIEQDRQNAQRLHAYYMRRSAILYRLLIGEPVPINQIPDSKWIKRKTQ